jgi:hypothetical protein
MYTFNKSLQHALGLLRLLCLLRLSGNDFQRSIFISSRDQLFLSSLAGGYLTTRRCYATAYNDGVCSASHFSARSVSQLLTASSRLKTDWPRVRFRVTLQLAVYRQSARLGAKPVEAHDQFFFFCN